jgi:hypothetical protein
MESRYVTNEYIAPAEANKFVQTLTYVAILKDYGKDVRIPKPDGYDPSYFACAAINDLCINPKEPHRTRSKEVMITYGKLPNNKYMINWPIEGNDFYTNIVNLSPAERAEVLKDAKNLTMSFLYFIQNELGFNTLGFADDEFPTDDLLPFIPYHRESRRIHGKTRFKLNYISDPFDQEFPLYRTNIAVGDYPVDHHHGRNPNPENWLKLYFYPIPSYGLPLGALIPKNTDGLIVAEKSISVSNLVNGTTRLQPVVLQIGQTAGTLAALAIRNNSRVEDVSVRDVQKEILAAGGYLMPYLDVEKDSPLFSVYQRIGVTGILRGEGKSIGWSNETWLRVDEPLLKSELDGLNEIYKNVSLAHLEDTVTLENAITLINNIKQNANIYEQAQALYEKYNLGEFALNNSIKRGSFAVLVDALLNPFDKEIDIYGNFM